MRDTLKKYFTSAASHHTTMAKLAKAAMDGCEEDSDEHAAHKTIMDSHLDHAETCAACAKACDTSRKADERDFDKLAPSQISAVTPTPPSNVRLVPRYGQQPLPTAKENPIFAEVFANEVMGTEE